MALFAAVLGAGVLGAGAQIFGAQTGAKAQTDAANAAIAAQMKMYQMNQGNLQPYMNLGQNAAGMLGSNLGTFTTPFGAPAGSGPGGQVDAASLQKFLEGTPGYQFTKQQGLESTTNNFTAQGLGGSGAEGKGLINYSEGLASTTYQQQLDNYLKQLQQQYGMLSGATGIGTQAASALAGVGTTTGQGIAQSLTGAGAAQAGANVASGNAIATGASNILPSYLTAQLLQKYGGGSGLNMFGGGSAVTNPVYNNTGQPT
jgi:hypothetical protein